jgi:hypothetical protein
MRDSAETPATPTARHPEGPCPLMLTGPDGALGLIFRSEFALGILLEALWDFSQEYPALEPDAHCLAALLVNPENPLISEGMRLLALGPVEEPTAGIAACCRTRRRRVCDPQLALALVGALTVRDLTDDDCSEELETTLGALQMKGVIVDFEDLGTCRTGAAASSSPSSGTRLSW